LAANSPGHHSLAIWVAAALAHLAAAQGALKLVNV
jgi:hypothetical protein